MGGNATFILRNTALLSVCAVEAPITATSAEFDARLAETYARTGMKAGMLERLAGVKERRWWPQDVTWAEAASMAGEKALAEAGITPSQIGVVINTSVTRGHLEPSIAAEVHHLMGLPASCLNFDVTNACLAFMNAIQLAGTMIDGGQVDYALIVNAEHTRDLHEATLRRLSAPDATADDIRREFASLTIGSGSVAAVLGRTDAHPEGHRVTGGVSRAGTSHHGLCVGDLNLMLTDSRALFEAGIALALDVWRDAHETFDWAGADWFVAHQTSVVHLKALAAGMGVSLDRLPMTVETFGNLAPAAVPFTLAKHVDRIQAGERVVLMGIGSGLNCCMVEIDW